MISFFIGLACGAVLGWMGCAIVVAGRIADLERDILNKENSNER